MTLLMNTNAKGATIATYAALASYADKKGFSFPSVPSIAKRAGISVKVARRECDRLVVLGYLERKPHYDLSEGQRSNRYVLTWQRGDSLLTPVGVESDGSGSTVDFALAPTSKNDGLTTCSSNQRQQSITAAEIVTSAWSAEGKTQNKNAVIRAIATCLENGIPAEKLLNALSSLDQVEVQINSFTLNSALHPKRNKTIAADKENTWPSTDEF